VAFDLRIEEVERDATDLRPPNADAHGYEVALVVGHEDLGRHRHERERQSRGVVARIALGLSVALVDALAEVAAKVEEPDPDERDAQLGRRLEVVPREDSETARVRRQALVEPELGGEIGHEEVVRTLLLAPPRHLAG